MDRKEIENLTDIKLLVDTFYGYVRGDVGLGPIFEDQIKDNWPRHLNTMYTFWQTLLLNELTYSGNPFLKHVPLPIEGKHFDRWIELFHQTVDELFTGERAELAKIRASNIERVFRTKLNV